MGKRIVFTNEVPNSHGFITRNNTIDFSKYSINPILLADHKWKDSLPIGKMTEMQLEQNGDYTGIPVFHKLTPESRLYSELYEGGWIATASIGSTNTFRTDLGTGKFFYEKDEQGNETNLIGEYNKDGFLETKKVTLLEISLPYIPSNYTAATKEALGNAIKNMPIKLMAYSENKINEMADELVTLEAKLQEINLTEMDKETEEKVTLESNETVVPEKKTKKVEKSEEVVIEEVIDKDNSNHVILEAKKQTTILEKIVAGIESLLGLEKAKVAKLEDDETMAAKECVDTELMTKEEEEKSEGDSNNKKEEEKDEEKIEDEQEKKFHLSHETKLNMEQPEIKTKLEMEQEKDTTLAADPKKPVVLSFGESVTFSKLMQDKKDGERIMNRVFNGKKEGKDIEDYKIILNSILNDKKYSVIADKVRFHMSGTESQMYSFRKDLSGLNRENTKIGLSFKEIATRLNTGVVDGINFSNGASGERRTTLSTSSAFASLDLIGVEWLASVIFALFPAEDWRNDIPVFGTAETGRNIGIIWPNIAANAPIYRGTNPSPAAIYTYTDTPVGLKLVQYWMAPTRWTPMDMHQLRYNMQDTGWAQNMNNLYAHINDDLLYTLAAGALANGQPIVYTNGTIDSTQPQTFLAGSGINKFYYNPGYAGSLLRAGFNDIISIEQVFSGKNFNLTKERVVAVLDFMTVGQLKQDKATQSELTRWINDQGADVQKISHTNIHERSRVAAFDQTGNTIIDMNASGLSLPATTQSCNLALVSSAVGIGLGMTDVFSVQDPANYGFVMSMDTRIGIRALRNNYNGVLLYAYNTPTPVI